MLIGSDRKVLQFITRIVISLLPLCGSAASNLVAQQIDGPSGASVDPAAERDRLITEANQDVSTGKLDAAVAKGLRVLSIAESIGDKSGNDLAETHAWIAHLYFKAQKYDEAIAAHEKALRIQTDKWGATAWQTISAGFATDYVRRLATADSEIRQKLFSIETQAEQLASEGRFSEAAEMALSLVPYETAILGEQHPNLALTYAAAGEYWMQSGQAGNGLAAAESCLRIRLASYGLNHPETAAAHVAAADCSAAAKDLKPAIRHFSAALEVYRRLQRPQDVARCYSSMGACWRENSDHESASRAYESAARSFEESQQLPQAGDARMECGKELESLERYAAAAQQFQLARQRFQESQDPSGAAWLLIWRGDALCNQPDEQEAIAAYRTAVTEFEGLKLDQGIAISERRLGESLIRQKSFAEANSHLKSAAAIWKSLKLQDELSFTEDVILEMYEKWLDHLALGSDFASMETMLKDWISFQRERLGPVHEEVAGILMQLAILYERGTKNFIAARDVHQQRLEILTKILDPGHPQILDAEFAVQHLARLAGLPREQHVLREKAERFAQHATDLFREGHSEEALAKIRSALEIYSGISGEESAEYADWLQTQALICRESGDYQEAERLYVRSAELTSRLRGPTHPACAKALLHVGQLYGTLGKQSEAAATLRTVVDVYRNAGLSGPEMQQAAESLVQTLQSLSWDHLISGDAETAMAELREILELESSLYGATNWRTMEAKVTAEQTERVVFTELSIALLKEATASFDPREPSRSNTSPEIRKSLNLLRAVLGPQHPQCIVTLLHLGICRTHEDASDEAAGIFEEAAHLTEEVYGTQHPYHAVALLNRAKILITQGKDADGLRLAELAESILLATLGSSDATFLESIITQGEAHQNSGEYRMAIEDYQRAMKINRSIINAGRQNEMFAFLDYDLETAAGRNPNHLRILRGLGSASLNMNDLPTAAACGEQIRNILQPGPDGPTLEFTSCLSNLAVVYLDMGDYQQAESQFLEALKIRREINGRESLDDIVIRNNLGRLYFMRGQLDRAEESYRTAISIPHELSDAEVARVHAVCQDNLALTLVSKGAFSDAEALYLDAIRLKESVYGKNHAIYATSLMNLGELYRKTGRLSEARVLLEDACRIMEPTLGRGHREYRNATVELAKLNWQEDKTSVAQSQFLEVLAATQDEIEVNAAVQSERQQFANTRRLRYLLDFYVSITAETQTEPDRVYEQTMKWKGRVLQHQRRIRAFRRTREVREKATILGRTRNESGEEIWLLQPDSARYDVLNRVNSQITRVALGLPFEAESEEDRATLLEQLSSNKEKLERELSGMLTDPESQTVGPAPVLPHELSNCLPLESAFVDFFEYLHSTPPEQPTEPWHTERRLMAIIVQKDQPIRRIDLGSAETLTKSADAWLTAISGNDAEKTAVTGKALRNLIWSPVAAELHKASLLFISPDGVLARIPFAAIPGTQPGSYLIEEFGIVSIPSAQLFPEVIAGTAEQDPLPGRVLAIGGVDYDNAAAPVMKTPEETLVVKRSEETFAALPGTQEELNVIQSLYPKHFGSDGLLTLQAGDATEDNFRLQAPNYPILHLGTHGFFASARFEAALNSRLEKHAGIGTEADQTVQDYYPGLLSGIALAGANHPAADRDDGILTAEEVASLDLTRVDLTVLSACETGLGSEAARGEALMSLQRAFQIAGARTVVSTLWKVPDRGTQALMSEFYRNLWEKKLGKLDALRQAQLSMLHGYDPESGTILSRGAAIKSSGRPKAANGPTPYHWGAFTLTGDWR